MQIGKATVVAGTEEPLGIGLTGAMRCVLRTESGELIGAILKRIPMERIVTECFAALLLRAWNIPVPDPFVVSDGNNISFASTDKNYPNLMKFVGVDALEKGTPEYRAALVIAAELACSLPTAGAALAADEAIANGDRNLGNILWDGNTEAWIDHERSLSPDGADAPVNKLAHMAVAAGVGDDVAIKAVASWIAMDRTVLDDVQAAVSTVASCETMVDQVTERLNRVGMLITSRFPQPNGLFSSNP